MTVNQDEQMVQDTVAIYNTVRSALQAKLDTLTGQRDDYLARVVPTDVDFPLWLQQQKNEAAAEAAAAREAIPG